MMYLSCLELTMQPVYIKMYFLFEEDQHMQKASGEGDYSALLLHNNSRIIRLGQFSHLCMIRF